MDSEQEQMIDDCMKRERLMTDWEQQFINNIYMQDYPLTQKQDSRLVQIWERIT